MRKLHLDVFQVHIVQAAPKPAADGTHVTCGVELRFRLLLKGRIDRRCFDVCTQQVGSNADALVERDANHARITRGRGRPARVTFPREVPGCVRSRHGIHPQSRVVCVTVSVSYLRAPSTVEPSPRRSVCVTLTRPYSHAPLHANPCRPILADGEAEVAVATGEAASSRCRDTSAVRPLCVTTPLGTCTSRVLFTPNSSKSNVSFTSPVRFARTLT